MRKRRWMSGLVAMTALALGVWALLHRGWDVGAPGTARVGSGAATPRATRAATASTAQRPNAGLRIRGTVVDVHGTPVAGARVSASWPEPGQTLSELLCPEEVATRLFASDGSALNTFLLPDCLLEASDVALELVAAREGEAPVYAETTTGADGAFLLEALPEGPLALWALGEHGAAMRPGIPAGAEGVQLVLEEGLVMGGTVVGEDATVPGATVTLFSARHTRFFDTTTDAEGHFRVGPLPQGSYFAAVFKDGWHPALEVIDTGDQQLTLRRAGRLSVQVRSGGVPVPGLRVRMAPCDCVPGDSARSLTTDAQGRFSLVLPTGLQSLSASHEGRYALAHVTVGNTPADVVLELGSAMHVEGTVSDDSGHPVAGARLELTTNRAHTTEVSATTGADGRYRAGPVEPGVWSFTVTAPGYLDSVGDLERQLDVTTGPVDITLTRAASVVGVVTDAEGQPVAGLQLTLVRPGPPDDPDATDHQDSAETDAEGHFTLDAEEPGDYRIDLDDAPFLQESFPVRAPSSDVHLTPRRGASVEGTVVDSSGLPLQDFTVELQPPEGRETLRLRRSDTTDVQGHFLLQGVPPGRYLLLASDNAMDLTHRTWRNVELRDGERTQVQLRMEPERTLSVHVVDGAGRPVEDVFVRAFPPQEDTPAWKREGRGSHHGAPAGVRTEADGRVTLRGLTEATYDVLAQKSGYTLDTGRSTGGAAGEDGDTLRVGSGTAEVHVVLKREAHVIGRLVDPDGAPVREFRVNGLPREDADGAFELSLVDADKQLVLQAEGLAPLLRKVEPRAAGADVDLGVLRMSRGRPLHGRVVDAETSEPLASALLMLSTRKDEDTYATGITYASARPDGTFSLGNVDLGSFTLTASYPGYLDQQHAVGPEQEELTIRLDAGAHVEVTVKDREGLLLDTCVAFHGPVGYGRMGCTEKGWLVQRGLAPGPYTVQPEPRSDRDRRFPVFLPQSVVVPASGRLQLRFEPQEGGITVKLRVPGGPRRGQAVALIPGVVPLFTRFQDLDRVFAQSLPMQWSGGEATFQHVPAGRATVFVLDANDSLHVHREELDLPASGTVSRALTPVWQQLSLEQD